MSFLSATNWIKAARKRFDSSALGMFAQFSIYLLCACVCMCVPTYLPSNQPVPFN